MRAALGLYVLWVAVTWLFEGRLHTLLRPEAVVDRLTYGAANLLVGVVGASLVLRFALRAGRADLSDAGFGPWTRTGLWAPLALGLGLFLYLGLGAPVTDPVVVGNVFAQVFPVSAAEIVVCWAVVVATLEGARGGRGWFTSIAAGAGASVLFGVYHFAHSPPFNSVGMVGFLTLVGVMTSGFFLVSRDVYATITFHNFLAVLGVARALAAEDQLERLSEPQLALLASALAALLVLVACHVLLLRGRSRDCRRSGS